MTGVAVNIEGRKTTDGGAHAVQHVLHGDQARRIGVEMRPCFSDWVNHISLERAYTLHQLSVDSIKSRLQWRELGGALQRHNGSRSI